ncbi:MAG: MarR family transcriptional regulator [Candidatus Gallionella acididurans]|uniref:MarR family transcriptional regulator n=1 Tax=Candidatus Gallionella acididurans TaxID=1796491 RepID=A0A139BQW5_9PROT|nr:MAG: MarR family transcriptional regulator [Candidatus Gallionella acididurans]
MAMARNILSKEEFSTLSDFRYRLRCFVRFSEDITRKLGITNLQYLLLLHVKGYKDREWATIGELAERLQTPHNGVVSLASRCEKLGLIYRQRGTVDKREVQIYLTPEGDKLVKKVAGLHRDELLNLQGRFRIPGKQSLGPKS